MIVRRGRPAEATDELVAAMRELGAEATVPALAKRLKIKPASVLARLRRAVESGAIVREGDEYRLPVQS